MARFLKRLLLGLLLSGMLTLLAVFAWIWQPYDTQAWRVKLPGAAGLQVRVLPVLMLATSGPGRWLLDRKAFSLHHGDIQLDDAEGLRVRCRQCWIHATSVSDKPIVIPLVELWLQLHEHRLKGTLRVGEPEQPFELQFQGKVSMRALRIHWTLPETPLARLIQPLQAHSQTLQQAHLQGSLSATGTLRWPKPQWSAEPVLRGLDVTGLDVSRATRLPLKYDCPLLDEDKHPEQWQWVSTTQMGHWLPMAAIIAEDAEFRHHPGYMLRQMQHLLRQESAEKQVGGSTITQQLAKYMFTNGERTWKRKLEELLYAVSLEAVLTKTDILSLYLNTVDWGPGICGAHAAARYYFATRPEQLNPTQAAWLAGIIRNPHRAWKQQFMAQQPDLTRAETILHFMPERARKQAGKLNFRPVKVAG